MSIYRINAIQKEGQDIMPKQKDKLETAEINAVADSVFDVREKIASLKQSDLALTWKGIIKSYDAALNLNLDFCKG